MRCLVRVNEHFIHFVRKYQNFQLGFSFQLSCSCHNVNNFSHLLREWRMPKLTFTKW